MLPYSIKGIVDTFSNFMSGLGTVGRDKATANEYGFYPLTNQQIEAAYRGNWIASKVIEIPATDATRAWRRWQADDAQIEAIEETENKFFVQQKVEDALVLARLWGGAAIIIGVEADNFEEPLIPESIQKDSLQFLHVVSRYDLAADDINKDIRSPFYGLPPYWMVNADISQGSLNRVRIHPSRVVVFQGKRMRGNAARLGIEACWGDSILQHLDSAIKNAGISSTAVASLLHEMKFDIVHVPNLTDVMSTQEGSARLSARFANATVTKSIINTILLDEKEEWERVNAQFGGVAELMKEFMIHVSGAADIPAVRFLSQSPVGLNSTGESDIRNYYDKVAGDQASKLTPAMRLLDDVLIRNALGDHPPEVYYEWNSLWQMTPEQKANIDKVRSEAAKNDADSGLVPITALATAYQNRLVEDGTYPGLEAALQEAEAAGDVIEPPPAPLDPREELQLLAANQNQPPAPARVPRKVAAGDSATALRADLRQMRKALAQLERQLDTEPPDDDAES